MDVQQIFSSNIGKVKEWITETLQREAAHKLSVSSLGFSRLSDYYSRELLDNSFVIYPDSVPMVPLGSIGIEAFNEMNAGDVGGVTYLDCFFVKRQLRKDISLHFHELVHVVQWKALGLERFLFCYAHGLLTKGYRESPLEEMAYGLEARFDRGERFDAEKTVMGQMAKFEELARGVGL